MRTWISDCWEHCPGCKECLSTDQTCSFPRPGFGWSYRDALTFSKHPSVLRFIQPSGIGLLPLREENTSWLSIIKWKICTDYLIRVQFHFWCQDWSVCLEKFIKISKSEKHNTQSRICHDSYLILFWKLCVCARQFSYFWQSLGSEGGLLAFKVNGGRQTTLFHLN